MATEVGPAASAPDVDDEILALLRCPTTLARLRRTGAALKCAEGACRYPRTSYGYDMVRAEALTFNDRYTSRVYTFISPVYDLALRPFLRVMGYSVAGLREEVLARLGARSGDRLLEVGVGTGSNLLALASLGVATRNIGVDISGGMLRTCRRRLDRAGVGAALLRANASALPFAPETFDRVLCLGGFNSISGKREAIEEMVRVAKPGAAIVINDAGLSPELRSRRGARLLLRALFSAFYTPRNCDVERPTGYLPAAGLDAVELEYPGRGYCWTMVLRRASPGP